jgi:hypothetical protein
VATAFVVDLKLRPDIAGRVLIYASQRQIAQAEQAQLSYLVEVVLLHRGLELQGFRSPCNHMAGFGESNAPLVGELFLVSASVVFVASWK